MKKQKGYTLDTDLTAEDLKKLCASFKDKVKEVLGKEFPDDAEQQLWGGIEAVFASWNGRRAIAYRRIEGIPDDWGTAVNVQSMVFGNMGEDSATGVAFSRNPGHRRERSSTANGWSTPRARTWWRASARRTRSTRPPRASRTRICRPWRRPCPRSTRSWTASRRSWRSTTTTCRTSSSRSRRAGCGCCSAAWASATVRPRCAWPWTWSKRDSSRRKRRSCA